MPIALLACCCCMAGLLNMLSAEEIPEKSKVEALVRQLGDERFAVREQAEQKLKEIGEPVEKTLKGFREDADPEIRMRVNGILDYVASLRRELKWIDPKFAGKVAYISKTMGQGVKLTFRNLSKKPVFIFWIDTGGKRQTWRGVLKPGETAICDRSYKTHVWLITDVEENSLGLYKIDMDDPVIAVREEIWEK
jgi:hypothetical protein